MRLRLIVGAVVVAALVAPGAAFGAAQTAILYTSDWPGSTEIFAVAESGKAPPGQLTFGSGPSCTQASCGFSGPLPSPNGRRLLYRTDDILLLAHGNGRSPKRVFPTEGGPDQRLGAVAWAPDSTKFAYVIDCCGETHPIHVVSADGHRDHVVSTHAGYGPLAWSADSKSVTTGVNALQVIAPGERWIAQQRLGDPDWGIQIQSPAGRVKHFIPDAFDPAWSPDGRTLAYRTKRTELGVITIASGASKALARDVGEERVVWSPDSRRLAYVSISGDLRSVTLAGRSRRVLRAGAKNAGRISSVAWTRVPSGMHYRHPARTTGLYTGSFITRLAGDVARVAYATCERVAVWTPPATRPVNGALASCMPGIGRPAIYDVAIAGGRVAYTGLAGGNTTLWWLNGFTFDPALQPFELQSGTNTCCLPIPQVAGAGNLLVFATRHIEYVPDPMVIWELRRVGPTGCDCPLLRTYREPIRQELSLDVDAGRILIARTDSVEVLDGNGSTLMSVSGVPVVPQLFARAIEAVLSDGDVYARARTELRDYDITTGTLRRSWPFPELAPPNSQQVLQDVAHGLAAYVKGSEIHVLRLVDGSDRIVAHGSLARFIETGLVYAQGTRLHFIRFSNLR